MLEPDDVAELQFLAEQALLPFIVADSYETASFNVSAEIIQSESLLSSAADVIRSVYDTLRGAGVQLYDELDLC